MPTLPHGPGAGMDDDWFVNLYKGKQMVCKTASMFTPVPVLCWVMFLVQADADVLQLPVRCRGTQGRSRTLSSRPLSRASWSRRCVSKQRLLVCSIIHLQDIPVSLGIQACAAIHTIVCCLIQSTKLHPLCPCRSLTWAAGLGPTQSSWAARAWR